MASECFTSHMTPYIYWFLCTLTGCRHRPRNSLVLYLGEIIAVQPVSTRRLALDFTRCYRFSPYYKHLTCRNFMYQQSAVTETTAKQCPLAFILFKSPNCDSPHVAIFRAVNTSCRLHQLPGACARDSSSLFHILASFVHGGVTVSIVTTTDPISVSNKTPIRLLK